MALTSRKWPTKRLDETEARGTLTRLRLVKPMTNSYSPEAIEKAVDSLNRKPLGYRINTLIARLCFRGIYFPQMGSFAWAKTILENRRTILKLIRQGFAAGLHAAVPLARRKSPGSSAETVNWSHPNFRMPG